MNQWARWRIDLVHWELRRQGWKMGFLWCGALTHAHLYPPLGNTRISRWHVLWGFFAFLGLKSGAQLEVYRGSCSDFPIPLFAEKLMFKNAPTPQEFKEGDDAVIVCDVVSSLPPTIIWKHKGRDVILKKDGKAQEVSWWCPFRDQTSISHQGSNKAHTRGSGEQNGGGHKGGEKQFVPNTRS